MPADRTAEREDQATPVVLAIDLGTGGPKIGLVSLDGQIFWHRHRAIHTIRLGDHGAEQDPNDWWDAITTTVDEAHRTGALQSTRVVAISVTGQYASTVPVDAAGEPVGNCLLWMDTRGRSIARRQFGGRVAGYDPRVAALWIRHAAGAPSLNGADPIGHRLYLQAEHPAIVDAARWLMEPIDHLTMRFTGVASATPASMAAAWLIDTRRSDRVEYDVELVRRSGINARQLPPLTPTASIAGELLPQVADRLGVQPGCQVVTALPDLHTAALGSGAVGIHQAHLAISTSSWISAPVRAKKTDIAHQIATVPGLSPATHLIIDNHEVGGLALDWFRSSVFSDQSGGCSCDEVTALANQAAPGSGNVLFTPWLKGERSPVDDAFARGGFHNLSLATGRAELARAVLEGVAFNSRWLHGAVEKFVSGTLDPVRIVGGGANSDLWCQIHADIMNRTIERPAQPMLANLRGAGLAAAIALGRRTLDDVARIVEIDRRFTPDPKNRGTYDRLFAQYAKRYRADKAMFRGLNASVK